MEDEKYICPHCGEDMSDFVHAEIIKYVRRKNAEKALAAQRKKPEVREQMNKKGSERLRKWREQNPKQASALAEKAKNSRTEDTFARQSVTIRETNRRKSLKFAELIMAAKLEGKTITAELETELLTKAREVVKAELKAERKAAKKKP